jgi:uncharacterized protein (DUF433 family)
MNHNKLAMIALLGATLFSASAAMAGTKTTCDQINRALKSGKSEEQVAKDLKVSVAKVKECNVQKH